ncbi:T9SS type A sorting domain-containing protein [Schleiferiaceae bacterium]|nr:T9SS type A sorting domain-containing protein [Schleiferiaceae bacterium]
MSPNPTRSVSYLSGAVKGDMISIFNAKGNIIDSFLATSFTKQEIPLQEYPNGVYVIRVFGAFEYQPIKLVKAD